MGMGDKKEPFRPYHKTIMCDILKLKFADCVMRECPHPAVQKKYGHDGVANVSIYACGRCRYVKYAKGYGGVGCGYEVELQQNSTSSEVE